MFVKYRAVLYSMLLTVFFISMILSFTSVGFPYSDDKANPRLQRFRTIHTKRTFYDAEGSVKSTHSGYLFSAYDRNALRTLESSYNPQDLLEWRNDEMCKTEAYCGFPLYRFDRGRYMKDSLSDPTVNRSKFTLLNVTRDPETSRVTVEFSIDYTTLTTIYLTPGSGWRIVNKSLQTAKRLWNDIAFESSKVTFGKRTGEISKEFVVLQVIRIIFLKISFPFIIFRRTLGTLINQTW